jgi:ribonuclease HII
MIIAGIDEAGLGPVLGPLVISASAFRIDDDGDDDLWARSGGVVARSAGELRKRKGRAAIAIADSKAVYTRNSKRGIEPLEAAVLSMLAATREDVQLPTRLGTLLGCIGDGCLQEASTYPWYGSCELTLPRRAKSVEIGFAANSLRVAFRRGGVTGLLARCRPIFVGEYNRVVGATQNKATAAFGVVASLLEELEALAREQGEQRLRVVVDRQGGRMHYREPLQRMFPDAQLRIAEESEQRSAYELIRDGLTAEISFEVDGESRCLPTALASMLSKYVRECCMEMINGFWTGHVDGLAPTAGYHEDGNRFFGQIEETLGRLGINKDIVYRCR